MPSKEYIEKRNNTYFIKKSRISLDSVVYAFLNGTYPEEIIKAFPLLTLEEVYGAITFYLANKAEIYAYLEEGELLFQQQREASLKDNKLIIEKLNNSRKVTT